MGRPASETTLSGCMSRRHVDKSTCCWPAALAGWSWDCVRIEGSLPEKQVPRGFCVAQCSGQGARTTGFEKGASGEDEETGHKAVLNISAVVLCVPFVNNGRPGTVSLALFGGVLFPYPEYALSSGRRFNPRLPRTRGPRESSRGIVMVRLVRQERRKIKPAGGASGRLGLLGSNSQRNPVRTSH